MKREMRGRDIFEIRRSTPRPGRLASRVEGREVLQVDVAGLREVGRHGDAEQAVLHLVVRLVGALAALAAVAVDGELAGARDAAVARAVVGRRVVDVDAAAADADVRVGVVEDAAERRQADQRAALLVGAAVAAADVDAPSRWRRSRGRATRRWWPGRCRRRRR